MDSIRHYQARQDIKNANEIIQNFIDLLLNEATRVACEQAHHLLTLAKYWYQHKFNNPLQPFGHKRQEHGKIVYDYHGLGKGEARLLTEEIFATLQHSTLIIGQGIHSVNHPIKTIVIAYCEENNIRYEFDRRNSGVLHCVRIIKRPQQLQEPEDISPPGSPRPQPKKLCWPSPT